MPRVVFTGVVFPKVVFAMLATLVVLTAPPVAAQDAPKATDVTSAEIQKFINALPRDRVSDRAIRTVEVTGDYRVGVYGVFRPQEFPGGANLHRVNTTEIYYMIEGVATLVTGGSLTDPTSAPTGTGVRGSGIEGGVSRRVTKGDVIIIPGHTPHWFSELETDIEYLIFRPDPDNRIPLR
jgi:mannose-6-phosphate isomerase-like protein (cupin superfamily)